MMRVPAWALACIYMFSLLPMSAEADTNLRSAKFTELRGWQHGNHDMAYASLILSCERILHRANGFHASSAYAGEKVDWTELCKSAITAPRISKSKAKEFFETHFQPVRAVSTQPSLFTGYYEPEVAGSRTPHPHYPVPVYSKPVDLVAFNRWQHKATGLKYGRLVGGKPMPYLTRKEIEQGGLAGMGLELLWLKSWADAFFMQVQGSGRVRFADGSALRVGYAGKTGLPYTAIGAVLINNGDVARKDMSMQAIRSWMKSHPDKSRQLMWHNKSFVFFRLVTRADPKLGPVGAHQVQLQRQHSLAVDHRFWAYGTPMWLETRLPDVDNHPARDFRQLMIAQDTGTAIKGVARGDIFFGSGKIAEQQAGKMQNTGRLYALLPKAVVHRLGLGN